MAPFPLVCESFLLTSLIALSNVIGTPVDISFGTSLFIVSVLAAFALSFFLVVLMVPRLQENSIVTMW